MTVTILDEHGDLVIEVIEYDDTVRSDNETRIVRQTAEFRVNRDVLSKHSSVCRVMLMADWKEKSQDRILFTEEHVLSMEVFLSVLHKLSNTRFFPLKEMWYLVKTIDFYNVDIMLFKEWFAQWYDGQRMPEKMARQYLYPTWRFDHPKAFALMTKTLAYESPRHIQEENPTTLYEYHLPPRIIQQVNAAKGRLRTVLYRGLFEPNETLLEANCKCKAETLFGYERHLYDIGVWPLEKVAQREGIRKVLSSLKKFSYEAKKDACSSCRRDYKVIIEEVISEVRTYFDGLCLDCLNGSKAKLGEEREDYWNHADLREEDFIVGCRFVHKQPTWYFSYMGRREERDRMRKRKRDES